MRKLTIAVAAIAFGGLLASAQADTIQGGPMKNGNQCFKYSVGSDKDARFGTWGVCAQTASVAITQTAHVRRHPAAR